MSLHVIIGVSIYLCCLCCLQSPYIELSMALYIVIGVASNAKSIQVPRLMAACTKSCTASHCIVLLQELYGVSDEGNAAWSVSAFKHCCRCLYSLAVMPTESHKCKKQKIHIVCCPDHSVCHCKHVRDLEASMLWKIRVKPRVLPIRCTLSNEWVNNAFKLSTAMIHAWASSHHLTCIIIMMMIILIIIVIAIAIVIVIAIAIAIVIVHGTCTDVTLKQDESQWLTRRLNSLKSQWTRPSSAKRAIMPMHCW